MPEEAVGYVQMVAEDLRRVHTDIEKLGARVEAVQQMLQAIQIEKIHALAMQCSELKAGLASTDKALERLASGQLWLSRSLIGAVLAGIVAFLFKAMGNN